MQIPTIRDELESKRIIEGRRQTPVEREPSLDSFLFRNKAMEIALATGVSVEEVEQSVLREGRRLEQQANITQLQNANQDQYLDAAYEEGLSPDEAAQQLKDTSVKTREFIDLPEFVLSQALNMGDGEVNPYAARAITNMEVFDRLLMEELEANDVGFFKSTLRWLDVNLLRHLVFGIAEDLTFRSNREGEEILQAFNSMAPAEFTDWAKDYIADRKSEGIFSRDSLTNLQKISNDARYLGSDPAAGFWSAFAVADIASLGLAQAATRGVRATAAATARTPGKVREAFNARNAVDVTTVLRDDIEGAATLARTIDDTGVQASEELAGRGLPKSFDAFTGPESRPNGVAVRDFTRKNLLVEKLERLNRRGSFGEYVSRGTLQAEAARIALRISDNMSDVAAGFRHVLVGEGSEDYKVIVRMGKDGSGAAFRRKMDAEAIAASDPSLRVVKDESRSKAWWVEYEERVNVLGLPEKMERVAFGNIVTDGINKMFGAATPRLGDTLGAKFVQAEAGQSLVGDLVKPYEKAISGVKGVEQQNLADFMTQLRDGDLSYMRKAPARESFESMYTTMYGAKPSQKVTDAYEALQDISDASWHIQSSQRLKRIVAEGGVSVNIADDFEAIGYRVTSIPEGERIFDPITGRSLKEAPKDAIIFKIPSIYNDHLYVTNVKSTRVLERVDVMPYNVGGPRPNEQFRYFVGTVKEQTLASGNKVNVGFRTILGSFGQSQAKVAVRELNNITDAVQKLLEKAQVRDIAELQLSRQDYEELGDVIRANNNWNKHVTDLEDLKDLARRYGFSFTERFVGKARDEKVSIGEAGVDPAMSGVTFGEAIGTRINMKRGDNLLMEFGGKKAVNNNPLNNISDQFGSEVFGYANRAASQNALVGWVKLAEEAGGLVEFPAGVPKNDFLNRFLGAKVTTTGPYNDLAAQLRDQQAVIKRMLNQPTFFSEAYESVTSKAAEFIFEKTGRKTILGVDLTKTDPASRLMQVGFYSKFGFLNADQFILQGLHSLTIAAISPKQGIKAMGLATPVMALAHLKGPARKVALDRLEKSGLVDIEEMKTLLQYIDESGRFNIDTQVIELQQPNTFGPASTLTQGATKRVGDLLDKSTFFFKEGERVTRTTGLITAFLEHRAKRPNIDPLSPEGKRWITNREQDLTFRMTTASRSTFQSGPMRVPTQWLTFSFRALENIVVGRNFTVAERAGMFAVMGPIYGLTGLGAGKMAGYVTEKLGYQSDDPAAVKVFNNVKYGLLDEILSYALGTETAYATRVAPVDQFFDLYKKLFDGTSEYSFAAVLLGPSGEIFQDMLGPGLRAIKNMVSGRTEMVREDLTRVLRNISTVDKAVKIRELIESGNYRSRTRRIAVSGLESEAAAAVLFGALPAPVQNYYDFNEMIYKKNDKYRSFQSEMKSKAELAYTLLTEGDEADMIRGERLWEEINDEIHASNFSNSLKISLQKSLINVGKVQEIMRNAIRMGVTFEGTIMQQQMY